jgi:hypothetical protein
MHDPGIIVVPTRRDRELMDQHCFHDAVLFHQGPEWLSNRWDVLEGLSHDVVPGISVSQEIVRPDGCSAEWRSTETD